MANVGPNVWYVRDNAPISTIGWSAVVPWAAGATIAAGALRRQLAVPAVSSERVFAAVVAGTTGGAEPAWVVTQGAKTTDNTVTWIECTGQPGVNGDLTNCPTWLQNKNTAVAIGLIICNAAQSCLFVCTTAGTTGNATEPTWNTTAGATTTDNAVTWTSIGAVGNFGSWAAPHARLANAFASGWGAAGNTFFVGDDHAETQSTSLNLNPGTQAAPCYVYCVDHAAAMPPGAGNLKTTASITNSGALTALYIYGYWSCYGIIFKSLATAGSALTIDLFNAGTNRLDACSLQLTAGSGSALINIGGAGGLSECVLNNTTMVFSAVGQTIKVTNQRFTWKNTASAISGTIPATLFPASGIAAVIVLDGVDLSAVNTTLIGNQSSPTCFQLTDCKLAAGVTISAGQSSGGGTIDVIRSDSAATIYQGQRYTYRGQQVPETVVIRTGGASDGVTAISWKITTTANALWWFPFECFQAGIWNPVAGATVTCTLCGIWNAAALPNNDQIWTDVEYLGSASSPLASFQTGSKANALATGTPLAADTSAWDSVAAARANSTAYAVGAVIKLASNPGQLFFCTTAGTSASSQPGGYTGTADGGSVTDGTAVFRAGARFKMVTVLSSPQPQMAGDLYAIVRAALPGVTFWVDPLITLR
jgi:hypothetical protein